METPAIVSFGEMLIDFVPDEAGVSLGESRGFIKAPGGAPANVACAVTKLGGTSAFMGKVGEDEFGKMLVDILDKNGVNTKGVCFDKEARTALAFVTLKTNGEREFMFYRNPSADMLLKESELNVELIKQAKIFHYGSISLITEPCRSAHLAAMKLAKEAGAILSYDPNVRLPLWASPQDARDGINSIWNHADIIKVNVTLAVLYPWHCNIERFLFNLMEFLTQQDPYKEEVVMSLWHDNLKLLLVTDGEKGCRYFSKKFKGSVKGFSVATVDTTGAGDAYVGSLLYSLANNPSLLEDENKLVEALTLANACGALATTQKGAIPALPTMAGALELVNRK